MLALVAVLLVAIGVLGLRARNASNGRVETLGFLSQSVPSTGSSSSIAGCSATNSPRDEVVNACESSMLRDQERVALLFDTDGNIPDVARLSRLSQRRPSRRASC